MGSISSRNINATRYDNTTIQSDISINDIVHVNINHIIIIIGNMIIELIDVRAFFMKNTTQNQKKNNIEAKYETKLKFHQIMLL